MKRCTWTRQIHKLYNCNKNGSSCSLQDAAKLSLTDICSCLGMLTAGEGQACFPVPAVTSKPAVRQRARKKKKKAHTRPLKSHLPLHLRRQQCETSFVPPIGDSQHAHPGPAVEDDWLTDFCWRQASLIFLGDWTHLLWRLTLVLVTTKLTLLMHTFA